MANYPSIVRTMRMAHLNKSPEEFVSNSVRTALYSAVGASALPFFLFSGSLGVFRTVLLMMGTFLVAWPMFIFFFLQSPKSKIRKREKEIESEILFAGRYLMLKLETGYALINTFEDASRSSGVSAKYFKEIMNDIDSGTPLETALDNAVEFNSSAKFKKILWSIRAAVKTGTDPTNFLKQVLKVISDEQSIEIQKYGKKLNSISLFYLIVACVIPSLGLTLSVILISFVGLGDIKNLYLYMVLVFLGVVQIVFLMIVRSIRPAVSL